MKHVYLILLFTAFLSCNENNKELVPVSNAQFEEFVNETNYKTDAEKYGWSIVQQDVYKFITVDGANWKTPDGKLTPSSKDLPVTQVSYNDAIAYCKWAKVRLPSYDEYWDFADLDNRLIIAEKKNPITPIHKANIIGNVWDITEVSLKDSTRLAGGSLFCSSKTCDGTVKERELYVDKETGNINIGFCVITAN
ncbi:MAG: SUMF1/EgtB/PvdO family nonheme iron enzyme [Flavobacteriales bacterium]|nr:SUMF1/EgtB/PvdO family nonheme iron enzyme [Flavobacteriales bacterium]